MRRADTARMEIASVGGAPMIGRGAAGVRSAETSRLGTSISRRSAGDAGAVTLAGRGPGGPVMTLTGSTADGVVIDDFHGAGRTSPGAVEMTSPTLAGAAAGAAIVPGAGRTRPRTGAGPSARATAGDVPTPSRPASRTDRARRTSVRAALSCQPRRAGELSQAPDATTTHAPTSATSAPASSTSDPHRDGGHPRRSVRPPPHGPDPGQGVARGRTGTRLQEPLRQRRHDEQPGHRDGGRAPRPARVPQTAGRTGHREPDRHREDQDDDVDREGEHPQADRRDRLRRDLRHRVEHGTLRCPAGDRGAGGAPHVAHRLAPGTSIAPQTSHGALTSDLSESARLRVGVPWCQNPCRAVRTRGRPTRRRTRPARP